MGQIKVTKNVGGIEGLCIIEPAVHGDARGYFMETYNQKDMEEAGFHIQFVQDNQSMSTKGVLRGLHFQKHYPQCKLVRAVRGSVFDVAVDLRADSPTYGKWYGVELTEENKKQFLIPEGFAHGFLVLSDVAGFCYIGKTSGIPMTKAVWPGMILKSASGGRSWWENIRKHRRQKGKVSVIIPVYNTEKYLKRCVDSVLVQSYENLEVILIDDGSRDGSGKLCDQYRMKDQRVHVIHQKNQGVSLARIHGYEKSQGEWIAFVDSDDAIEKTMVETLVRTMVDHSSELAICQFRRVTCAGEAEQIIRPEPGVYDKAGIIQLLSTKALYHREKQRAGVPFELWGKLYQWDLLKDVLQAGVECWYEEDMLITMSLMYRLNRMAVIADPFYVYYERAGQATSLYKPDIATNFLKTMQRLQQIDKASYFKEQLPSRALMEVGRLLAICAKQKDGKNKFRRAFSELVENGALISALKTRNFEGGMTERLKRFLLLRQWGWLYFFLLKTKHLLSGR